MTDEPVLTSSWCTNWGAYNTPRLWAMVANEDDGPGRAQVSAWRSLAGSVRSQRAALLQARADLVAAWPPDENESALAFVNELDVLIKRLDMASADADSTASGLDNIISALQTAKTEIQPLWDKYRDKHNDLVPSWWDDAEDEIDEQARTAMIKAERAVEDSVALLTVPEKYELTVEGERSAVRDPGDQGEGSAGGGTAGVSSTGGGGAVPSLLPTGGGGPISPGSSRLPRSGGLRTSGGVSGESAAGRGATSGLGSARGAKAGTGARGRAGRAGGLSTEGLGSARGGSRSGGVRRPSWLPEDEAEGNRRAGAGTNTAGGSGASGRGDRRGRRDDDTLDFDPDNPWEVRARRNT